MAVAGVVDATTNQTSTNHTITGSTTVYATKGRAVFKDFSLQ